MEMNWRATNKNGRKMDDKFVVSLSGGVTFLIFVFFSEYFV